MEIKDDFTHPALTDSDTHTLNFGNYICGALQILLFSFNFTNTTLILLREN